MAACKFEIRGGAWIMLGLWLMLVPVKWIIAILFAAAIHELGHLAAIWACGGRVWSVVIGAFGARICTGPLEAKEELVCALAGPTAGGLLWLFRSIWPEAALAAIIQTAFNLLPVYPLDGGRALRAIRNICCK